MTRECTGVCVYRMACRFLSLLLSPTNYPPPFEQTDKSQIHLAIFKAGVPTSSCECAPASAHTAPLRTRLGSRAGSLSAHPAAARAPCALPPSLSPPVPREQVFFGRSRWIQLACTAAPCSCEKWPLSSCAGHRLRPQPRSGLYSRLSPWLCPPSASTASTSSVVRVCVPGCGAMSCVAARPRR